MNEKTILLKDIKPNNYNPNEMTKQEFDELVKEVQHLGKIPKKMILRKKGDEYEIVDGEHSYKALKELGIEELQEDSYEIVAIDDVEAKRQTYKRNLGGKNNPVKLGLMFAQVLEESGISMRKLAEQWEISEGMIRNNLLYAEMGKLRSDYADIATLTNEQVRTYLKIAEYAKPVADLWFAHGCLQDALVVLDDDISFDEADYNVMATFQKLCERIMNNGFDKVLPLKSNQKKRTPVKLSQKDKEGYVKEFKQDFNIASNLQKLLEQMEKHFIWNQENTREYIMEYLVIYYDIPRFFPHNWMEILFSTSIRNVDNKLEFMLTPEELKDCFEPRIGQRSIVDIMQRAKDIIKKKYNIPTYQIKESSEKLEDKLDKLEFETTAPEYIKNSTTLPLNLKRAFVNMQFANEEAKKAKWEIIKSSYEQNEFKKKDLYDEKQIKAKITSVIFEKEKQEDLKKEYDSLLQKSEKELAELFIQKIKQMTKGNKEIENDLLDRMVKNFTKEHLYIFVWLATRYFKEMEFKQWLAGFTKELKTIIK